MTSINLHAAESGHVVSASLSFDWGGEHELVAPWAAVVSIGRGELCVVVDGHGGSAMEAVTALAARLRDLIDQLDAARAELTSAAGGEIALPPETTGNSADDQERSRSPQPSLD